MTAASVGPDTQADCRTPEKSVYPPLSDRCYSDIFQFPSAIKFSMIAHPFGAFALIGRDKNLRRAFPDEGLSMAGLQEIIRRKGLKMFLLGF